MAWRVHLSDRTIYRLDILPGKPEMLCAWVSDTEAVFFHLWTGAAAGRLTINAPEGLSPGNAEAWEAFIGTLRAPNGALLPVVRLPGLTLHRTDNDHVRLYEDGHTLTLIMAGKETLLPASNKSLVTVQMERAQGNVAALDERGRLYVYHGGRLVFAGDVGLRCGGVLPELVAADGTVGVFASDERRIVRVCGAGRVCQNLTVPYPVGKIACSRSGRYFATSDKQTGVLRVYTGERLAFTHQKFAIDLFAAAKSLQLLADIPTPRLGTSALALTDDGILAFALGGVVTVSSLETMQTMPGIQAEVSGFSGENL